MLFYQALGALVWNPAGLDGRIWKYAEDEYKNLKSSGNIELSFDAEKAVLHKTVEIVRKYTSTRSA
jgi:hypothetical protein